MIKIKQIKLDIMKAPLSPLLTMASLENLSVKLTVTVGDGTSQKLCSGIYDHQMLCDLRVRET